MPRLLTAAQIAEEALKKIGAFSPRDEGPDPDEFDRALSAFDLRVQELAGTVRLTWLIPTELTLPLTAGQGEYNLMTALGAAYPPDGIQFPIEAWLEPPVPVNRRPLDIVRRADYYAHSNLAQTGEPAMVYIDRRSPPTLFIYPVINLAGYSLKLGIQTYAPDLVTGKKGAMPHGLPAAWQRWGIYATASDISDGSVRRLPDNEIAVFERKAARAEAELRAFDNKERFGRKRFVKYRDF